MSNNGAASRDRDSRWHLAGPFRKSAGLLGAFLFSGRLRRDKRVGVLSGGMSGARFGPWPEMLVAPEALLCLDELLTTLISMRSIGSRMRCETPRHHRPIRPWTSTLVRAVANRCG